MPPRRALSQLLMTLMKESLVPFRLVPAVTMTSLVMFPRVFVLLCSVSVCSRALLPVECPEAPSDRVRQAWPGLAVASLCPRHWLVPAWLSSFQLLVLPSQFQGVVRLSTAHELPVHS